MGNKPKPDDRSDNVGKIQKNINHTIKNMEIADEIIAETSNEKTKVDLTAKNKKRDAALNAMRNEIKDEANFQNNDK